MADPTVVLADGDILVRDILRLVCNRHTVEVVAEADTAEALRARCLEFQPTVVVTADCFGSTQIDEVLEDIISTGSKVIVVSGDPSADRMTNLLANGVSGYLLHDAAPDEVAAGVRAVARGAAVLNPTAAAMVLGDWRRLRADPAANHRRPAALTRRETEVLVALADGLPTKAIGRRLRMATKTVENHKIRIFDKLGVHTQAHAVTVALREGLVRPRPPDPIGADASDQG